MDLIPGLPDDLGLECLIRIPYDNFSYATSVCKRWKSEINLPLFHIHSKSAGLSRHIVVMVQAHAGPNQKYSITPGYQLTVYELESGNWSVLPSVPGFSNGLPPFCKIVRVGFDLVVMGGLNPRNWGVSNYVFVYNFLTATWRRGPNMPGCKRLFFGCASDNDRRVFLAGGHDNEKNALRSSVMYDVAGDKWTSLPDMVDERDECKCVFHHGKFYVIGGYNTLKQGQFEKSAEVFDPLAWQWGPKVDEFLGSETCPRTCVDGGVGGMYMYQDGAVVALDHSSRTMILDDMINVHCMIECVRVGFGKLHVDKGRDARGIFRPCTVRLLFGSIRNNVVDFSAIEI